MDYEKLYKEALERAKKQLEGANVFDYKEGQIAHDIRTTTYAIFPELKESESEKVRKELIDFVKSRLAGFPECEKYIAWLEKQGEQKPADKVEPKFHEGDWVVFNNKHQSIYQVEKIEDGYYILRHTHGGTFRVCVLHDESLRLWTIQDAKDGDVLVCEDFGYTSLMLFKSFSNGRISLHCWHNSQTTNFHINTDVALRKDANIYPATKEQRDLLFSKMKEAGYEWDAEKKELKKIEQKPAWSEEDEATFTVIGSLILDNFSAEDASKTLTWLHFLKDRVIPQKQWKVVDKEIYVKEPALAQRKDKSAPNHGYVICYDHTLTPDVYERYIMISDVCPQNQWKPSDEQLYWLKWAVKRMPDTEKANEAEAVLEELLEQLKKLI